MTDSPQKSRKLPRARTITLPDKDYQLRKTEQERGHDMPGASIRQVPSAFFRPFNDRREGKK